jgi:hypothetical protein
MTQEKETQEVAKALDSIFTDTPAEEQMTGENLVRPEDSIQTVQAEPEEPAEDTQEQVSIEDDLPEALAKGLDEPVVQNTTEEEDLLPMPGEEDDVITPAARKVIEKYAFESRELKRQLKELQDGASTPAEDVEPLQSRIQELEAELGRLDLERSPEFRKRYDAPIQNLANRSLSLLIRSGVEEEQARDVLRRVWSTDDLRQRELPFDDLEVDISSNVIGTILQASVERDDMVKARQEALEDWKSSKAAVEEQAKQEKQARDSKAVKELLSNAVSSVREENNPFFQTVEGNQEWNTTVVDHYEKALTDVLRRNDPSEVSKLVAHGLTFSALLNRYAKERQRRQALEQSLSSDTPSSPAPGRPINPAPRARASQSPQTSREVIDTLFSS